MRRIGHHLFAITLSLLLLAAMPLHAVSYRVQHVTSLQGLPHQQVEAMVQDNKGNIWFGTRNGLARYDGYSIRGYYHDHGNAHSLGHNFVKALFFDSKNRLWICHTMGVSRYRPATDDFVNYAIPGTTVQSIVESSKGRIICAGSELSVLNEETQQFTALPSLGEGFIISLAIDRHDRLYVATNSSVYSYNAQLTKITRLPASYYADFITGADGIIPMTFDHAGRLWIGRNGKGVMAISLADGTSKVYPPEMLSDGTVRVIREDSQHRMLLGTEKGLNIINPDGRIEVFRQQFGNINMLSDNAIYSILCDRNRNVWVGSYFGGVDLLQEERRFAWESPGYAAGELQGKVVRQMREVSPGLLWIATEDGGVSIYNTQTRRFAPFTGISNLGSNVHSLYYDAQTKDMWMGTFRNGLFRYNLSSRQSKHYEVAWGAPSNSIFDFARQPQGRLWVASTQGLRWYDPAADVLKKLGDPVLDVTFVYCLAVDGSGNLWAGSTTAGLFRVDARTGKVTNWRAQQGNGKLRDDYVTCLYAARDGKIWVGTNNNGLQILDPKTGVFTALRGELLLSRSTVCAIGADRAGHVWVSTSQGLFCYAPASRAITHYTIDDGLPTNQFNFASSLLAQSGRMYFGTVNGLVGFDPTAMTFRLANFAVHLKSLWINGTEVNAATEDSPLTDELDNTTTISLSYDQARSFLIDYGVVSPGNVSSVIYQVWLEGIDKGWRDVGTEHRLIADRLEPGKYVLHVRANNSNIGWEHCPEKVLTIEVAPPFYRSLWAYLLYALALALGFYYAQRTYKRRLEEKNEVKMAIMEKDKVKEIDHAKFSFFTTVSHELKTPLSLIVAPLKSIDRSALPDDSRNNLDIAINNTQKMERLINELVTFNKVESDNFPFYIQRGNPLEFIAVQAVTFRQAAADKGLTLTVECEDNGEEVWFSPSYLERILNNLVSNAIKFTPAGGQVGVKGSITTNAAGFTCLLLKVQDTGIGIAPEEHEHIFENFYQTGRGYNANSSGWGIGLSLVKRLVGIHKGEVSVESEPHQGSTFTVTLNVDDKAYDKECLITDDKVIVPLKDYSFSSSMLDGDEAKVAPSSGEDDKPSILIVEDNTDLLAFLADYFSAKYHVLTAKNGREALEIASTKPVQLVISDIMMPEMDGIELCQRLKSEMVTSHLPVILLTAKNEQEDVVAGYKSGAEAYVSKPFDPQVLDLQVNNILQLVRNRQSEIVNARTEDVESTSLGSIDKDFIQRINQLIDENMDNSDFSVLDVTRQLGISRSLLHIKMRNLVNMPIGEYIRHKRMAMAKKLLAEGYNVSETAYRCGFSDPNYFSKTFRKFFDMSPTEFLDQGK
jgi:ligand-binding sensor domain-containing protein/signal transduction histidine kinase/DNA-binding response OmpR family regulator